MDFLDKECCRNVINMIKESELIERGKKYIWFKCCVCNQKHLRAHTNLELKEYAQEEK